MMANGLLVQWLLPLAHSLLLSIPAKVRLWSKPRIASELLVEGPTALQRLHI